MSHTNNKEVEKAIDTAIIDEYSNKVTKYGYNDEYGDYQNWLDGVRPIMLEFASQLSQQREDELRERIRKELHRLATLCGLEQAMLVRHLSAFISPTQEK